MGDRAVITAFPLQWPSGWPRMSWSGRKDATFSKGERKQQGEVSYMHRRDLTVTDGVERVLKALALMGIDRQDVVVSTNVRTRLDGLPRSGEPKPSDPGTAVYWETRKKERRVMAIDRYTEVADNLAAIALTLDAMRAIERHGGAQILERAFTGFVQLPAPGASKSWRDVLGVGAEQRDFGAAKTAYRNLASAAHPDRPGGSHDRMAELNRALVQAEAELAQ